MSGRRTSGTSYCVELVADFEQLAISLALPKEYRKRSEAMTTEIFLHLRRNAWRYDIDIDRVILGGSNGKGTGISYVDANGKRKNSDSDLVLLVNYYEPPFEHVLRSFQSLLTWSRMNFISVKRTNISVQCIYDSGYPVGRINFDVLPAKNHVKRARGDERKIGETQAQLALRNLKGMLNGRIDQNEIRLHSSAFCEKTVDVVADFCENEFYLRVVRLAKYWNSQIEFGFYIPARSSIIETIAIDAQIGRRNRCLISGFRRFLVSMANFGNLYVNLNSEPKNDPLFWQVKSVDGPIIIDPVNVYNNMAYAMDPNVIDVFEKQARKTLDILNDMRDSEGYRRVRDPIKTIFSRKCWNENRSVPRFEEFSGLLEVV